MAPVLSRHQLFEAIRIELAAADDAAAVELGIARLRDLCGRVGVADPLFDSCITAIVIAERKGGACLLAGQGDVGKFKSRKWQSLARMDETEFKAEIERAKAEARRRRDIQATCASAEKMLVTRWHRAADGTMTRFIVGLGRGDNPQAVESELMGALAAEQAA